MKEVSWNLMLWMRASSLVDGRKSVLSLMNGRRIVELEK